MFNDFKKEIVYVKIETCISEAYEKSIEKHNKTIKNNRYVVGQLIDATCFLAKQELRDKISWTR